MPEEDNDKKHLPEATESSGEPEESDDSPENQQLTIPKSVIDTLPEKFRGRVIESATYYKGPLPPPSMYGEYDRILPGAAERLLKITEDQTNHRIW